VTAERARIGITAGDPAGVGPEIVVRALTESLLPAAEFRIYGEESLLFRTCRALGRDPSRLGEIVPVDAGRVPADFRLGIPSAYTGKVAAASVRLAARAALGGELDAIVTAPISKSALRAAGVPHPGHTELLSELASGCSVAMMFVTEGLKLSLATIHVPLARVASSLTADRLLQVIRLTGECLVRREGLRKPRIAALGLNPHAGEGGLFGDEEATIIAPALTRAKEAGFEVDGPFPADSFFLRRGGEYDAVIAMYHDQGLIPVKLLSRGRAVNVTLGLPFLRTSVDHGTAFDLAGKGTASPESLVEAIRLAIRWVPTGGCHPRP
jgi:4-hydroxythreonine-4-phosphate dehydrogenase